MAFGTLVAAVLCLFAVTGALRAEELHVLAAGSLREALGDIAEVEIDPETGVVAVAKYTMVNDFGVIVNPLLVAGQAHGGVVQGIGQALMERVVFDEDGQLLTGSFTDYALPRASDAVAFAVSSHPVPAKTNPLGAKGCGEAGCAGSLPAVMNALVDALSQYGIRHIDMPATPFKVWQAITDARATL